MGSTKDLGVLRSQPGEIVDCEEAPVVELLGRYPPAGEPVMLLLEDLVQRVRIPIGDVEIVGLGAGSERERVVAVPHDRFAIGVVESQLTLGEHPSIVVAEDGNEYVAKQLVLRRIPVDVEERGVGTVGAVLEDVPPPRVGAVVDGHVVGHDVENVAHPVLCEGCEQTFVRLGPPELLVDARVVDDVVTVRAAGARLQVGRAVEVTYPEVCKIGDDRRGVVEAEAGVKLHTVGRTRSRRCGRPSAVIRHAGAPRSSAPRRRWRRPPCKYAHPRRAAARSCR